MQQEKFTLNACTIGHETDRAVQVTTADGEIVWLPLSQVHAITRNVIPNSGRDRVVMSAWIAKQKGFYE
jgi:hypothetical protein